METEGDGDAAVATERDRELQALRDLTSAMAAGGSTVEERIERVLSVGCEHLGYPTGLVSRVNDGRYEVLVATTRNGEDVTGETAPLGETYCRHTIEEGGLCVIADASRSLVDDPADARWGLESYVGTPVLIEGETYGTICFVDGEASRSEFSPWQETLLDHLREWIESELEHEQIVETRDQHRRLLEATFNSPALFVGILDTDGRLLRANETALSFVDADGDDIRGTPFPETPWWNHGEEQQRQCRDAIDRAAAGETVELEADHVGAGGERIRTAVTVRPVVDNGSITGIIVEGRDVTDLKRREEQMEFFNRILRHDILNGMNVVQARAGTLENELEGERGEHAETILDWSHEIIDLTQKIRSVLTTLSGERETDLDPVELRPILEAAADRARSLDEASTVTVSADGVTVAADDLLDEVLGNVVVNAVEHAGPGASVAVSTSVRDGVVAVRITDDGPGIPTEQRDAIFERGEKGDESGGTGFGLFFVSTMVEQYGGSIRVEESDSGGAAFVVELARPP